MKYWFSNACNKFMHDSAVHMTQKEVLQYNRDQRPLPYHVILHPNDSRRNNANDFAVVDISGIKAPETFFELEGNSFYAVQLHAAGIISNSSRNGATLDIYHSNVQKIEMGQGILRVINVQNLSQITFGKLSELQITDMPDLVALNALDGLRSIHPTKNKIENAPNLKDSDTVGILRVAQENGDDIYLQDLSDGRYYSRHFNDVTAEQLVKNAYSDDSLEQNLLSLEKRKEKHITEHAKKMAEFDQWHQYYIEVDNQKLQYCAQLKEALALKQG